MENLHEKLMEADEEEYDIASPGEMDVVKALEPLIDKYGVKAILPALEAFADFSAAFHNLIDTNEVWEKGEIERDKV